MVYVMDADMDKVLDLSVRSANGLADQASLPPPLPTSSDDADIHNKKSEACEILEDHSLPRPEHIQERSTSLPTLQSAITPTTTSAEMCMAHVEDISLPLPEHTQQHSTNLPIHSILQAALKPTPFVPVEMHMAFKTMQNHSLPHTQHSFTNLPILPNLQSAVSPKPSVSGEKANKRPKPRQNDEDYRKMRAKNNIAAKRSRDARTRREQEALLISNITQRSLEDLQKKYANLLLEKEALVKKVVELQETVSDLLRERARRDAMHNDHRFLSYALFQQMEIDKT